MPPLVICAGGAIVNTTLKSGSNEIHGSVFEFIRNDNVDARPTFAPSISEFRRNQFGGSFGGPITQNKAHFFAAVERTQQDTFQSVTTKGLFPSLDGVRGLCSNLRDRLRRPVLFH